MADYDDNNVTLHKTASDVSIKSRWTKDYDQPISTRKQLWHCMYKLRLLLKPKMKSIVKPTCVYARSGCKHCLW